MFTTCSHTGSEARRHPPTPRVLILAKRTAWARRNPSCADVWLLRPPPGVGGGQPLEAVERGRKVLWASEEEEEEEDGQTLITDFFPTVARAAGPPRPLVPAPVAAV